MIYTYTDNLVEIKKYKPADEPNKELVDVLRKLVAAVYLDGNEWDTKTRPEMVNACEAIRKYEAMQ